MNSAEPFPPLHDVSTVILGLRRVVGAWGVRQLMSAALNALLGQVLCSISGKIARLLVRFEAGRLWRCKPRVARVAAVSEVVPALARIWPARFGWLVRLGGWQVAGCGAQLRFALERPEMVALLIASPQARRILWPLCRMLAVEASVLRPRLPGAAAEVMPDKSVVVAKTRLRRPRPVVDWGRIPLPRGVLTAARRQGFGKIPHEKV